MSLIYKMYLQMYGIIVKRENMPRRFFCPLRHGYHLPDVRKAMETGIINHLPDAGKMVGCFLFHIVDGILFPVIAASLAVNGELPLKLSPPPPSNLFRRRQAARTPP
jgi:hypothetical protein